MFTRNAILEDIKDVPVNRLEDLYYFVHSLNRTTKRSVSRQKKILAFAGSFGDMSQKDYDDFLNETKNIRTTLFSRNTYT